MACGKHQLGDEVHEEEAERRVHLSEELVVQPGTRHVTQCVVQAVQEPRGRGQQHRQRPQGGADDTGCTPRPGGTWVGGG